MQKRILSFILCAVLICGLFPTTATAMGSQAEYTGVCTHGSHEGYIELTSEYLATHNDRLSSGKYYLSGDLNYSGSYYLDVAPNANVELCLNGHTLTFSNQYLLVLDDASLLLENGKVKLESSANKVIWGYNSEAVEIRNCDIDGNGTATYLVFINGDTGAQEVKITDSKLHNICDSPMLLSVCLEKIRLVHWILAGQTFMILPALPTVFISTVRQLKFQTVL